ncbi:MAG: head GIN domain-containing protein [Moheibacter sp.]
MKTLKLKYYLYGCLGFLLLNCHSEEGFDCFKKQGEEISRTIELAGFTKIHIGPGIALTVKESDEQMVSVRAGENLINDIRFEVVDGELFISDENGCGFLRNTSVAHVHVSVPQLVKIYSASQFFIRSEGVLHFPYLELESGIVTEDSPASVFDLHIENESLTVNDNIASVFKIRGRTGLLKVQFWGSNGRFEGGHFQADEVSVFHRSTNDMIVYPVDKVSGALYSTGNLVLRNVPSVVDVEELYSGQVVYP